MRKSLGRPRRTDGPKGDLLDGNHLIEIPAKNQTRAAAQLAEAEFDVRRARKIAAIADVRLRNAQSRLQRLMEARA